MTTAILYNLILEDKIYNNKMYYILLNVIKKKVQFYSYKFSDGKIYVGYIKNSNLFIRHMQHKQRSISPIFKYLNNPKYEEVLPKIEETFYMSENDFLDEKYKIIRKIFDKYTNDTTKILNVNLFMYGY